MGSPSVSSVISHSSAQTRKPISELKELPFDVIKVVLGNLSIQEQFCMRRLSKFWANRVVYYHGEIIKKKLLSVVYEGLSARIVSIDIFTLKFQDIFPSKGPSQIVKLLIESDLKEAVRLERYLGHVHPALKSLCQITQAYLKKSVQGLTLTNQSKAHILHYPCDNELLISIRESITLEGLSGLFDVLDLVEDKKQKNRILGMSAQLYLENDNLVDAISVAKKMEDDWTRDGLIAMLASGLNSKGREEEAEDLCVSLDAYDTLDYLTDSEDLASAEFFWGIRYKSQTEIFELLYPAIVANQEKLIRFLAFKNVDLNAFCENERNALSFAILNDAKGVAKVLLELGVDVEARNALGMTALHIACMHNKFEAVKILVEEGADINVAEEEGETPALYAVHVGNLEMLLYLVSNGGNIHAANARGMTPLDIARYHNHTRLEKFLLDKN